MKTTFLNLLSVVVIVFGPTALYIPAPATSFAPAEKHVVVLEMEELAVVGTNAVPMRLAVVLEIDAG